MTDLEKVLELQTKIKNGEVAVSDFVKYSEATRQVFYNLRDDKVDPEKMTVRVARNLARCYDILFPVLGESRDYRWGRVIGFLYFIKPLDQNEWDAIERKPNTAFVKLHKRRLELEPKRMLDWQQELAAIMDTMQESDMTDDKLNGMLMLGHGKELHRLTEMERHKTVKE